MKAFKDILSEPLLTEKSSDLRFDKNQYVFRVRLDANKIEIKKAVETRFNVIVDNVTTQIVQGKKKNTRGIIGKKSTWKKAFVRVRAGDKIPEFEGA
ncbi:50S ribosomal protein L23 [Fibrobacterota bacterium]